MQTGRIDVHSHLLPGIDDGCKTLEESIACARELVREGYTHSFCTPHVWPNLPENTAPKIAIETQKLQTALDAAGVPLKLFPGGELNLRADLSSMTTAETLISFGSLGKFVLADIWVAEIPEFFATVVKYLQSLGTTVILAHPERMRAVQMQPDVVEHFTDLGLLLQGNLQCLGDPPGSATRDVAEKFLAEGRYFLLGTDLHGLESLPIRLRGLRRAIEAVGEETVNRLTIEHPRQLLPTT